jgi:hypothetical protein
LYCLKKWVNSNLTAAAREGNVEVRRVFVWSAESGDLLLDLAAEEAAGRIAWHEAEGEFVACGIREDGVD